MEEIEIKSLGKLKPHPDVPEEWLISEPKKIPLFGGEAEITFTLQFDSEDEDSLLEADKVMENFLQQGLSDRQKYTSLVYKNYRKIQNYYDSQTWGAPPLKLNNEDEIWQYIYPQEVYVCRGSNTDKNMYVLITCGCEWESEHGLQLVFKDGRELTKVSDIDYEPRS